MVYEKLVWSGLKTYGAKSLIESWPSKRVIRRHIINVRKKIRPPYQEVTPTNKSKYHYDSKIKHFENERILTVRKEGEFLLFYYQSSLKFLLKENNNRITTD